MTDSHANPDAPGAARPDPELSFLQARILAVLVEKRRFPDTEPFLDQSSRLLAGPSGLYVIEAREIKLLKIN